MQIVWFIVLSAIVGAAAGYWFRGADPGSLLIRAAHEDRRKAREVMSQLHQVAARVTADVGLHTTKVQEISDELSTGSLDEQGVIDTVSRLMEANRQMETQLRTADERLRDQERQIESHLAEARTDALTGLANRRAFDDELKRRIAEFHRHGRKFSMLLIDVDYFKKFNDTYGHQAGDEVLRGVARVLRLTMREMDLVSRYGGEEFALILPGTLNNDTQRAAERARQAIEKLEIEFAGQVLRVTVSVGAADLVTAEEPSALIERADKALYAAKGDGRNCGFIHEGNQCHKIESATARPAQQPEAAVTPVAPHDDQVISADDLTEDTLATMQDHSMFNAEVGRRIAEWKRGGLPISVALIQIDKLAQFAEQQGRETADVLLRATRQFLDAALREMDVVARHADDCFSILLPGATAEDATQIVERIRLAIERCSLRTGVQAHEFTVSVALVRARKNDDKDSIIERAEKTLAKASAQGGNRCLVQHGETQAVQVPQTA